MKYTYDIAKEYREDLRSLNRERFMKNREKEFLKEVKQEERTIEQMERLDELEADIRLIGGMISSTEYALFWIESGHERMAGEKRPITNKSKEQRTQLWGEIEHAKAIANESPVELSPEKLQFVEDTLSTLSTREREAYISVYGKGNTQEETAEYLGVSRNAVKMYIGRARAKIDVQLLYGQQTVLPVNH